MLPFSTEDLDAVTTIALENTAGVVPHPVDECSSDRWLVASLSVTGPWVCHIEIAIDAGLAEWFTKQMWDQEEVQPDEVRDAVGEIANVIAGGVKGMTPHPGCGLTLPVVSECDTLELPGTEHMRRCFTVMGKPCIITTAL
jgi:hypothetical protein